MHTIEKPKERGERINLLSLKDLEVSHFCGSGKGGSAKNKVASGVMLRHLESGAMGRASDSRSEHENKVNAFKRLCATPQMKFWLAKRLYEVNNEESILETVERECEDVSKFKLEVKDEQGRWVEVTPEHFNKPEQIAA